MMLDQKIKKRKPTIPLHWAALLMILLCGCASAPSAGSVATESAHATAIVSAVAAPTPETVVTPPPSPVPTPKKDAEAVSYGAWIPYWDYLSAISEIDHANESLDTVIAFAAIFDAADNPFLLDTMWQCQSCLNILYSDSHTIYLSVVNDVELQTDVYDGKSVPLLRRLLETDESIDAHIEALMQLLYDSGAEALEIDYEGIKSDSALWERYVLFLERLYQRTSAEGYPLRAVLSWDAARYADFPAGPAYSIMCYNLYGLHSGPGPKANREFLTDTFQLCRRLPGDVAMAFATGGFEWHEDGTITGLTQQQAEARIKEVALPADEIQRDEESGALHCTLVFDGAVSEIWYADGKTLSYWRGLALDAGYKSFDLFRLGGNDVDELSAFWRLQRWRAK